MILCTATGGNKNERNKRTMARHHDELLKTMTDEQKKIFEKFDDCWSEYMSLAEAAIFECAFKLGAQMILDIQDKE